MGWSSKYPTYVIQMLRFSGQPSLIKSSGRSTLFTTLIPAPVMASYFLVFPRTVSLLCLCSADICTLHFPSFSHPSTPELRPTWFKNVRSGEFTLRDCSTCESLAQRPRSLAIQKGLVIPWTVSNLECEMVVSYAHLNTNMYVLYNPTIADIWTTCIYIGPNSANKNKQLKKHNMWHKQIHVKEVFINLTPLETGAEYWLTSARPAWGFIQIWS